MGVKVLGKLQPYLNIIISPEPRWEVHVVGVRTPSSWEYLSSWALARLKQPVG